MKGFLCYKGFSLYTQIWNDQPPVSTILLSWAFMFFGPSVLVARLVAAGFGLLLFGAFYQLVRQRSGTWSALLAVFFLAASPGVLQHSVAVMLEVPAIGTALLSAWLLFRWGRRSHWGWLWASGAVMGVALQVKLTAVVVAPAVVSELVLLAQAHRSNAKWRTAFRDALQWAVAVGILFAVIGLIWGNRSYEMSWKSHFMEHPVPGLKSPDEYRFQPTVFLDHAECVAAAVVGLLLVTRQRRWREAAFPIVLLSTALVVHALHRPWWTYYYLHLAVPLAWLAGLATGEVIRVVGQLWSARTVRLASPVTWQWVGLSVLTALALAMAEARLEAGVKHLRQSPRASASPVLARMIDYADRTRWIYAQPVIYPFHARLAVPPELAVVMLKRFWSGQITTREIVDVCRRYQPEQLLLYRVRAGGEWKDLLDAEYAVAYQDREHVLYVAKRIENKQSDDPSGPKRDSLGAVR